MCTATTQWRPFLKITLVTSPSIATTDPERSCRKSPQSIKLSSEVLKTSPHTQHLYEPLLSLIPTTAPSSFQRSDEMAVIDCRESVRTWKLMQTHALLSFNELCTVETDTTDANRFKWLWKIYEAAVLRKTHTISTTSCFTLQIPAAACCHNEAYARRFSLFSFSHYKKWAGQY